MPEIPETFTGAAKKDAAPVSVGALRSKFSRPRITVPLYLDGEAVAESEDLEQVLLRAREADEATNDDDTAPAIERQLLDANARAQESQVDFVLQAISHRAWAKLIGNHPPTPEQLAEAPVSEKPDYDLETLPGALVRAQLLTPDAGDEDDWNAFWDELSDGQMAQLWGNALALQLRSDGSLGKSAVVSEILRNYAGT